MKHNSYPGLYIAIEGIDGSGKTTQVEALSNYAKQLFGNVYLTSVPSKSKKGMIARSVVNGEVNASREEYHVMIAEDVSETITNEIIPRLEKGEIVIGDRSFWSQIAYGMLDLPYDELININSDSLLPHITIWLDAPINVALNRIEKKGHKKQIFETEELLRKVRKNFLKLYEAFPSNIHRIDSRKSVALVFEKVLKASTIQTLPAKKELKDKAVIFTISS